MNRKVTEVLSCMTLTHRPTEVSDFAFRFVATKSPATSGPFRAQTARSDYFLFAFRHFCEMLALQFALGDVIVGLGPPTGGEAELSRAPWPRDRVEERVGDALPS